MNQLKKLAKNKNWFVDTIVRKAPNKVKDMYPDRDFDQLNISQQFFGEILAYIAHEAEIKEPSKQQKYHIFTQFNDGKNETSIIKDQYDKFATRIDLMLQSTINN